VEGRKGGGLYVDSVLFLSICLLSCNMPTLLPLEYTLAFYSDHYGSLQYPSMKLTVSLFRFSFSSVSRPMSRSFVTSCRQSVCCQRQCFDR